MQLRRGRWTCEVTPREWDAPHSVVAPRGGGKSRCRRAGGRPQGRSDAAPSPASRVPVAPPLPGSEGGHVIVPTAALTAVLALTGALPSDAPPSGAWPLRPQPEVVAPFEPPASEYGAGHRGVDLAGSPGQPVRSALPGTLAFTGVIAGRPVVVVDHGDTRTTYEPVVADAAVGTRVAAGDRIGRLALPGSHCLPRACLHWGWLRGEAYLDPLLLVGGGPVRLLPLDGGPSPTGGWRPAAEAWAAVRPAGAPAGRPGATGPS